jgi:hypothetical protein
MNKKYDNNNIIIASRAYFLQYKHRLEKARVKKIGDNAGNRVQCT